MRLAVDRYVFFGAVASTAVCVFALMGLFVVVDAFGRLDDFMREAGTWNIALHSMLKYYALHLPLFFMHVAPFAVLMGALFTLARLEKHNELLAIKSCGISLRRVMLPILVLASFVSGLMYANRQWLIPHLAEDIEASEKMIMRAGRRAAKLHNVFLQDSSGTWFVVGRYDLSKHICYDTWIISRDNGKRSIRYASRAVLVRGGLLVERGTSLLAEGSRPLKNELIRTNLLPDDFIARASHMKLRSYSDLSWILSRNPRARDVAVMLHKNLAFPLVVIVIPLIGMSLMFMREEGGMLSVVGIAILVSFMYFVLDDICSEVARQGFLSPVTGAWAPISVFSAAGIYLFTKIRT